MTKPIPEGMSGLIPHLVCSDASAAIAFYTRAFGAKELFRMPGPDGKLMHAEIQIGDAHVMLGNEAPQHNSLGPLTLKGTPVTLHRYVEDVDAAFAKALEAGAKAIMPPTDMFWGDRYGQVEDPFGHRWALATHQRDLTPAEIEAGMKAQFCGA